MAGSNHLGDAVVRIVGDTAPLDASLSEARGQVEAETAAMGEDAEKNVGGGFEKAGEKIAESTKGVRKLQSAISSTVGIVTGLVGSLAAVLGVLRLIEKATDNLRGQGERIGGLLPEIAARLKANAEAIEQGRKITDAEVALQAKLLALAVAKEETEKRGNVFATNHSKELAQQAGVAIDYYTTKKQQLLLIQQESELAEHQLRSLQQRLRHEHEITMEKERRAALPELFEDDARKRADAYAAHLAAIRTKDAAAARENARAEAEFLKQLYDEVGKQQEARAKAVLGLYDKIRQDQTGGLNNMTGTIETLAQRVEAVVEAAAFAATRRKS